MMHESLHNHGLEHAGRGTLEYGDATDVMGDFNKAGSGLLCPNAPNQFRIGWSRPIMGGNLTVANFTINNVIRGMVLPAQGLRDDNMIVINLGAKTNVIYLSYRVRNTSMGGYDSGLGSGFDKKVLVHSYNGVQSERVFGFKPNLLDSGPLFGTKANWWVSHTASTFKRLDDMGNGGAIKVIVKSNNMMNAVIDLCRITEWNEESCGDGLDNDCDGLYDVEDPDCA
jgi:hypothetical protein